MKSCIIHHLTAKQSLKLNSYVLHTAPTKKKGNQKNKTKQEHEDTHTCANTHTLYTQFLCHALSFDFNLLYRGFDTGKWLDRHYFTLQYQIHIPGLQFSDEFLFITLCFLLSIRLQISLCVLH